MSLIPNILEFLRRPASGSEALRAKLSEVELSIPAAEAEAARLAAARAAKLLDASDKELEAIEKAGADACRNFDRLNAARDEIARRLALAETEEAKAKLDADRAEAEKMAEATAERVRKEYVKAAREIADLIEALDAAERRVSEVNAKLEAAGRFDDFLPPVEARANPEPADLMPGPFRLSACSLVPAPGFGGLGDARRRAEVAGYVAKQIG